MSVQLEKLPQTSLNHSFERNPTTVSPSAGKCYSSARNIRAAPHPDTFRVHLDNVTSPFFKFPFAVPRCGLDDCLLALSLTSGCLFVFIRLRNGVFYAANRSFRFRLANWRIQATLSRIPRILGRRKANLLLRGQRRRHNVNILITNYSII